MDVGFCILGLVCHELLAHAFGGALDLLGRNADQGRVVEKVASPEEVGVSSKVADDVLHLRRQGRGIESQHLVIGKEAVFARLAKGIAATEDDLPQRGGQGLGFEPLVAKRHLAARADKGSLILADNLIQGGLEKPGSLGEELGLELAFEGSQVAATVRSRRREEIVNQRAAERRLLRDIPLRNRGGCVGGGRFFRGLLLGSPHGNSLDEGEKTRPRVPLFLAKS